MNGKKWFLSIIILSVSSLFIIAGCVFWTDPFFHYRSPNEKFYYLLQDQRSQNDGITKHFDYDAIITGTSMTENFAASQFDRLFGTDSIKVTYSGATYKEINDNLKASYESGHSPKYVLRGLDYTLLVRDKDELRLDMGEYPEYLTNDNPFDDVKYLLNKDVVLSYVLPLMVRYVRGVPGGHTDFDTYSYSAMNYTYSRDAVLSGRKSYKDPDVINDTTDEEITMLMENMKANVTDLAKAHPETVFLYFFPPYSMSYFGGLYEEGNLSKELDYKKIAIEMMLECDNIHIYSFTTATDITADLDRYRDQAHYDQHVNEWIIDRIAECEQGEDTEHRITKENAEEYLSSERELLENYDYNSIIGD